MGANMVRRLIRGGHECVVYDRSEKAMDELAADGADFGSDGILARHPLRPNGVCSVFRDRRHTRGPYQPGERNRAQNDPDTIHSSTTMHSTNLRSEVECLMALRKKDPS